VYVGVVGFYGYWLLGSNEVSNFNCRKNYGKAVDWDHDATWENVDYAGEDFDEICTRNCNKGKRPKVHCRRIW
jgi:hypothetical protein